MAAIIQNIHEVMFMYCCAKNRGPLVIHITWVFRLQPAYCKPLFYGDFPECLNVPVLSLCEVHIVLFLQHVYTNVKNPSKTNPN